METAMLKKLRVKFIALNMATVAMILVVVFTAICVINYQQSTASVYSALDAAIGRAGDGSLKQQFTDSTLNSIADPAVGPAIDPSANQTLAQPADSAAASASDSTADPTASSTSDSTANTTTPHDTYGNKGDFTQGQATPPEIGGKRDDSNSITPVAVYSVENDSSLVVASAMTTASIADDVLTDATPVVLSLSEGSGYLDTFGLFYAKRDVAGTTYVAFADASAASSWRSLALTLTGVGIAALLVFFVVSVFFSRWALKPVARAWDQQQQFVADASHELKTPLTVILANNAILREHPERSIASQDQWIESTQTEAEHMQELVRDMLDLARPNRTEPTYVQEPVDLTDLVEGDLLQFESVAFERNITLTSDIDRNVRITGNTTRLRRLVSTLLDNACKYVNDGGTISVTLHQTVRHIELHVHNTGASIAAEDLPHVFDRFYRADKARVRSQGSYGLGLAIARQIVEEHGGTIEAASQEGIGTTFTVTLPLSPEQA